MSGIDTKRRFAAARMFGRYWGEADIARIPAGCRCEAIDPNVWSGRALQENFDRVGGCAVLHQCIRPLIGALCAPGHHGYQRACDLISGQASMGLVFVAIVLAAKHTNDRSEGL